MRKITLLTILLIFSAIYSNAQESDYVTSIDRSVQPKQGETPTIDLKQPKTFKLKNGLTVLVVEDNKLPTFSVRISIDNPPSFEGDKAGLNNLSSSLFGRRFKKYK